MRSKSPELGAPSAHAHAQTVRAPPVLLAFPAAAILPAARFNGRNILSRSWRAETPPSRRCRSARPLLFHSSAQSLSAHLLTVYPCLSSTFLLITCWRIVDNLPHLSTETRNPSPYSTPTQRQIVDNSPSYPQFPNNLPTPEHPFTPLTFAFVRGTLLMLRC